MKYSLYPLVLLSLLLLNSCAFFKRHQDSFIPKAVKPEQKVFKVQWSRNLDPAYDTGNLPIGLSSAFIYSNLLFIGDLRGNMTAHNLEDGREVWVKNDKDELGAIAGLYKDHLIYGSYNGRVFARHYLTGEMKASVDLGSPIESTPIIHKDRIVYHIRNHQIYCLDAATLKILWSYRRSVPFTTTLQRVSDALAIENKLIVGFADGDLVALSLEDGNVLWERKLATGAKFIDVDATPVLFNDKLYVGSVAGALSIVNPDSGVIERTLDFSISRSPLVVDKELFIGTTLGDVAVMDSSGDITRQVKLTKTGISSMLEWKGQLVVSTLSGEVFYLNKKTLEIIERFDMGSRLSSVLGVLNVQGDYLALFSSRNRLYVFR